MRVIIQTLQKMDSPPHNCRIYEGYLPKMGHGKSDFAPLRYFPEIGDVWEIKTPLATDIWRKNPSFRKKEQKCFLTPELRDWRKHHRRRAYTKRNSIFDIPWYYGGPRNFQKFLIFWIAYKDWSTFWTLRMKYGRNISQKIDKIRAMGEFRVRVVSATRSVSG